MVGAIYSKSLIQFSVDGWGCVPSLLFTWGQTMVEVMKTMVTSFKRSGSCTAPLKCPQPCSRPPLTHTSARDSWTLTGKSGSVSCGGHCSFLLGPGAHKFLFVPSKSLFPRLCKFWWLYGGVNGDLLQEGLCHTQVCCIWSPCPWGRPLLTQTSTGDAHSSVSVSVGSLGPHVHKVCLSPLSVSGEYGVWFWTQFRPSYHLAGASPLFLDVGYLLRAAPAPHSRRSSAYHLAGASLFLFLIGSLLLTTSLLLYTLIFTDSIPIWSKITSPRLLE